MRLALEQFFVHGERRRNDLALVEVPLRLGDGRASHGGAEAGVAGQPGHGVGEGRRIAGGTSRPVDPSSTTCRQPRMSVATTGSPMAAASMAERGKPSRYDASTYMSNAA